MGYKLNFHYEQELETFEARLNQLTTKILLSGNQLNIWSNKITDYRALQMDEAIVCDDEMNDKIDIMEDYIINQRLILQDMAEKVIFAKKILLQQNNSNTTNNPPPTTTTNSNSCATNNNNNIVSIIPTTNIKSSEWL